MKLVIQLNKEHFYDKGSILRIISTPVKSFGDDFQIEVDNLIDTLNNWNIAVGLSAPQIGIKKRFAVIRINKEDEPLVIVNPIVTNLSGKKDGKKESCLSLPKFRGSVQRRFKLSFTYQDRFGTFSNMDTEGFTARVILHEIDHLDGILFVDRMEDNSILEEFDIAWE
jgi:peptide deformylase